MRVYKTVIGLDTFGGFYFGLKNYVMIHAVIGLHSHPQADIYLLKD
jgi:hypothetical protein